MDDKFRSRKWHITLLVVLGASGLLVGGYIEMMIWRDVIVAACASYFTANVFDKKVQKDA